MENLTQEQRLEITREEIAKQPLMTLGSTALYLLVLYGLEINAAEISLKQTMTCGDKTMVGKLLITWEESTETDEEE